MSLSFVRTPSLPATLASNTLYLVRDETTGKLNFVATDSEGQVAATPSYAEIQALIQSEVSAAASVATQITAATEKTTPVDNDTIGIVDSVSGQLRWLSFVRLKNWISSLFVSKTAAQVDGNLSVIGLGRRIFGDFSSTMLLANRVAFQSSTENGLTAISAIPNGTSDTSAFHAYNKSDPDNAGRVGIAVTATDARISTDAKGAGTNLPLRVYTGSVVRMEFDNVSGNNLFTSGAFGYGVGNGGTVTQQISKAAEVTLNKPSGRITTHDSSIAAGQVATFTLNNLSIGSTDRLDVQILSSLSSTKGAYQIWTETLFGKALIFILNRSTGPKSEILNLQFTVMKASQS